jgi:predicted secreted protein
VSWFTGVVLYAMIWWLVLFAVLPLGIRAQADPDPVTGWRGAPAAPRLVRKALITTLVALLVWGVCLAVIESPLLSFRTGWLAIPADR